MAIRYDASLNKQVYDAVHHYNKALKRLEQKGVSKAFLPDNITTQMLKSSYTDRRKLLRRLNQLNSLSSKGDVFKTKGGLAINEGSEKYVKHQLAIAKAQQTRKINEFQRNNAGARSYSVDRRYTNLLAKRKAMNINFKTLTSKQSKRMYVDAPVKEKVVKRDKVFYQNFHNMLFSDAYIADVDSKITDSIEQQLSELSPDELLDLFEENKFIKSIVDNYHLYAGRQYSVRNAHTIERDLQTLEERLPSIIADFKKRKNQN